MPGLSGTRLGGTGSGILGSGVPEPASSSIMKSRKPDWRKGRPAQHTDTESRKRQADLMVQLTSLWGRGHRGQRSEGKGQRGQEVIVAHGGTCGLW